MNSATLEQAQNAHNVFVSKLESLLFINLEQANDQLKNLWKIAENFCSFDDKISYKESLLMSKQFSSFKVFMEEFLKEPAKINPSGIYADFYYVFVN
jgi:hypothetical protein